MSANEAEAALAQCLFEKMEHLDPSPDERSWEALTEFEREFYLTCVHALLQNRPLVQAAMN
jgi:hypothetical protein